MNLEFDADAEHLVDRAAEVFARVLRVGRLRDPSHDAWRALVDAGWAALGGAFAAGELDLGATAAVARRSGRQAYVEQFVTSGFVVPALLVGARGAEAEALRGRLTNRPAVMVGDGRRRAFDTSGATTGWCFGVEGGAHEFVRVRLDGGVALEFLVDPVATIDRVGGLSLAVAQVTVPDDGWRRVELGMEERELDELRARERLVHAAALLGCADETLRLTRDHTLARVQFDVPIGTFQAVKHALADVMAAIEVAWAAVLVACADPSSALRADVARLLCLEAAHGASVAGAQFHGGLGFTWESDLHYYLKAALDGALRYGSRDELAEVIAGAFVGDTCSR